MLIVPLGGGFVLPDGPKSISPLGSSRLGLGSWGKPTPRLLFPSPSPKKSQAELGRRCAVTSPIASHDPTPSAPSFPHLRVLWEKHISTPWKEASSPLIRFAAAQNPPSPPGGELTVAESFNLSKSWLLGVPARPAELPQLVAPEKKIILRARQGSGETARQSTVFDHGPPSGAAG